MTSPYSVEATSVVEIPTTVTVMDNTVTSVDVVEVGVVGPQGAQGETGVQGPQGVPGVVQSVTATDTTITVSGTTAYPNVAVGTVPAAKVSGLAASATTDTTNAGNITSGTLSNSRLLNIPNVALANSSVTINGLTVSLGGSGTININGGYASAIGSTIQVRHDTAGAWVSPNPILAVGEIGFESSTGYFKIGDGFTAYNSLLYATDGSNIQGTTLASNVVNSSITKIGLTSTGVVHSNATGNLTSSPVVGSDISTTTTVQIAGLGIGITAPSTGISLATGSKLVTRSSSTTAAMNVGSTGGSAPSGAVGGDLWSVGTSVQSLQYSAGSAGIFTLAYSDASNMTNVAKLGSANTFSVGGQIINGTYGSFKVDSQGLAVLGSSSAVALGAWLNITNLAASDKSIVVKAAASQTGNLHEWQNSAGTVIGKVDSSGTLYGSQIRGLGSLVLLGETSGGGYLGMYKLNAAISNPGAGYGRLYFRDGTTVGTLKLVVRAGAAGAETTILDNIPQ